MHGVWANNVPQLSLLDLFFFNGKKVSVGTIIMSDVCCTFGEKVVENCMINTTGLLVHDSVVGPYTHVATRATKNSVAEVGANVSVRSHAVILNYCNIGDNPVIGIGPIVKADMLANSRLIE